MIIARAPLRIPLGGGGTDLASYYSRHDGFILSAAIDKYVYIYVNHPAVDQLIRLKYSKTEEVHTPTEIQHPLLREALLVTGTNSGMEIAAMADVPSGTGLGSSGSFLVALLQALHASKGENLPTQALAEEACHIEIERAKQPVGKHDQYMAAFGGITCLEIAKDGAVHVSPLAVGRHVAEELRANILLFYTGIRRDSHGILQEQGQGAQDGKRNVVDSMHRIKEIGLEIKDAILREDLPRFGRLMHEHWEAKKRISSRMSDPNIDRWYGRGMAEGALGGKLMGAGGGGFLMFYAEGEARSRVRAAMAAEGLPEMHFNFDFSGSKVLVNL
ncbi:MAG: galactokinase [Candidatus Eisenbacteria bacterium]